MFGRIVVLAFALCLLSGLQANAKSDDRPNFLVILCDDLGYGDLACYGNRIIQTPHLDKLAGQGVRLTSCYAAAPVCSSSRAGLLTGRTPTRVGVYDWIPGGHPMHLQRSEITIASLLRESGYATAHVGKWHLNGRFNQPDQPQPGDHGFEHWFSTQNNASPTHENPTNFVRNGKKVGPQEGFSCQLVAGEAVRWLSEERDKNKPFFCFVCFHEPHEPINSPDSLVKQYPAAKKRGEALYYANVSNMDRAVGKLMATLDSLALDDNTLVFFTSDNGPETLNRYGGAWRSHGSPGDLRGMKLHIYEAGIRVPGIVRWPGHTPIGEESDTPVSGVDLLPTLCEIAGIKPPTDRALDGTSVLGLFNDERPQRKAPLFWHYFTALGGAKVAMRDGDWKLVAHLQKNALRPKGERIGKYDQIRRAKLGRMELYNLRNDLSEQHDLSQTETVRMERMIPTLRAKYQEVIAEGPLWKTK